MKLYVLCGLSRAGKTTYGKKLAAETDAELISFDDYQYLAFEYMPPDMERVVLEKVRDELRSGKDVIYDSMNLRAETRKHILTACQTDGCKCVCVCINTPLDIIAKRGKVMFADSFELPSLDEGFDEVRIIQETGEQ